MKLHLTLLTFILISINSVFSQNNNLQFNRALFEEFTITVPLNSTNVSINQNTSFGDLIVPTGKVWKIESINTMKKTFFSPTYFTHENNTSSFMINHFIIPAPVYPIWLPAGTYPINFNQSCNGYTYQITWSLNISGIEFNLVP